MRLTEKESKRERESDMEIATDRERVEEREMEIATNRERVKERERVRERYGDCD